MQMYPKLATAVAISMLVSTAALAQTQTASDKGQWQASKLIHMNVYNAQNEKIGDIKELMLDKNGKVNTVAIGVGGFLGMGERDVAVKFDQLKWSNDPPKSASSGRHHDGVGAIAGESRPQLSGSCRAGCDERSAKSNAAVRLQQVINKIESRRAIVIARRLFSYSQYGWTR